MEAQNLTCVICMDLFHIPVTIPCGHTFCQACITAFWDAKSTSDIGPQCPVCNEKFSTRPVLNRNVSLHSLSAEATENRDSFSIVDCLKDSEAEGARAMPLFLCERHKKPLVYYCKQENMSVCCECAINECKTHDKVMLETERENREMLLKKKSTELEKRLDKTERSIAELSENTAKAKVTLDQSTAWVNAKFTMLLKVLAEKQEATETFIEQEKGTALFHAETRLSTLQERAKQLKECKDQIAALSNLSDTQLVQESRLVEVPTFENISVDVTPNLPERLNGVTDVLSRVSKLVFEDLEKAVCTAVGQDKQVCSEDKRPVLAVVPSPAAPCHRRKEGLNPYRCTLTFDPRTANSHLRLSQENQQAEHLTSGPRQVPTHEARFDHTWQVLCFEGFTHGQHYWELEVSKPWAYLGVTYEGIPRKEKGKRCMVGMNELSWSLQLDERKLCAWHNGRHETVAGHSQHSRIGMLLDYEAGTLTYYGDGQTRLHAFHCAFNQQLFPACWIGEGVRITICST
ncbi:E3 ubiquitin-protein ligase TRIM65 [Aplochiton taeniatus]